MRETRALIRFRNRLELAIRYMLKQTMRKHPFTARMQIIRKADGEAHKLIETPQVDM